ncbi:MAG: TonB-dependent receptor [Sinimarinibacterium sp.]|jgi:iron complex outermembrane receptor protein
MRNTTLAATLSFAAGLGLGCPLLAMAQSAGEAQSQDEFMSILGEEPDQTSQPAPTESAPGNAKTGAGASAGGSGSQETQAAPEEGALDVIPVDSRTNARPQQGTPEKPRHESTMPIEEIVVSATKRDTSLMETGIAISVLDSDQMKFQDINTLEDMQNSVPGLNVGAVMGTPLITIRGVGLNLLSGLGNPGVASHYDGIYLARTGSAAMASVDLDRVEVLRGPQGTLYGRNATGGSVNFMSKRPADEFGAGLTAALGDFGRWSYEGYAEGPVLLDDLAMRAYFKQEGFDGYGINETNGHSMGDNDSIMGRLALTYQVTESLGLYGSYSRRDDEGTYPYSTALTTVTSLGGVEFPAEQQSYEPYNVKALRDPHAEKTTNVGNLTATWQLGDYTLKSITGYVGHDRNEDMSAPEIERFVVYIFRYETSDAWSQEFNLSGSWFDGTLDWLVGAYYTVDKGASPFGAFINLDELFAQNSSTGQVLVFSPVSLTRDMSQAVFLDGSWSVLDDLRVIFGARLSEDRRELTRTFKPYIEDTQTGQPASTTVSEALIGTNLAVQTCEDVHNDRTFSSMDPKLGIEWDVAQDTMVYMQYQTGFKSGGFNAATGCEDSYEPERIKAYELGLKTTQLDGGLVIKTAVYSYDYSDYQVEKVEGFGSVIDNAAAAGSRGAEIEATLVPATWLTVDAEYSYLDAVYKDYMARDNFNNSHVAVQDGPIEDLSGNRLSRSPKHTVSIGATFSTDIDRFGLGTARFRVEGYYSDDVYFREFNRPIEKQDAYRTANAFLSIDSAGEMFSLSMFAKNITDARYQVGQISFDSVYYRGAYFAPPRTLGASLSVKF